MRACVTAALLAERLAVRQTTILYNPPASGKKPACTADPTVAARIRPHRPKVEIGGHAIARGERQRRFELRIADEEPVSDARTPIRSDRFDSSGPPRAVLATRAKQIVKRTATFTRVRCGSLRTDDPRKE